MASLANDSEFCTNCCQKIPAANWVLHEVRCEKINTVCDKCGEVVLKVNVEEHEEEYHSLQLCSQCGQPVERWKMDEHMTQLCEKVPMACEFCKLHIILSDFAQHEEYCGSQTEPCGDCQRLICRKDMMKHLTKCDGVPVRVQPTSTYNRSMNSYYDDGDSDDLTCGKVCAIICCCCFCWPCILCCGDKCKMFPNL